LLEGDHTAVVISEQPVLENAKVLTVMSVGVFPV